MRCSAVAHRLELSPQRAHATARGRARAVVVQDEMKGESAGPAGLLPDEGTDKYAEYVDTQRNGIEADVRASPPASILGHAFAFCKQFRS